MAVRRNSKDGPRHGRPIVVLHVTDIPILNAAAVVTRQRLESIGFNVVLKGMDWSWRLRMAWIDVAWDVLLALLIPSETLRLTG